MNQKARILSGGNARTAALQTLSLALALGVGMTWAQGQVLQYTRDGAYQDATSGGWDLPKQGSCSDASATTRPDCQALRLNYSSQTNCTNAGHSWSTGVCNDLVNTTQSACNGAPGRFWNSATNVCAITMKGEDRNDVQCMKNGGTWVTAGACIGNWVMPARNDAAYDKYNDPWGGSNGLLTSNSPGDQCLRCHNDKTFYNTAKVRYVNSTLMMGHKNMSRPVVAGQPWGGPPFSCTNPIYTTEEDCLAHGQQWNPAIYPSDDSGNTFDWPNGKINVGAASYNLNWIYADWLSPLPRAIYTDPAVNDMSYSCARCHTTGWTSDATLKATKLPEKTWAGITWQGTGTTNQVKLAGGVAGDANIMASWDSWGIVCSRCHSAIIDNTTNGGVPPFTAPTNMSGHHSNMTSADNTAGVCTDVRWVAGSGAAPSTYETNCINAGGTFLTACSQNPTPGVCGMAANTQAKCTAVSGTWVSAPGWCSNAFYSTSATCTANGFTWQDGWCKTNDPQANCTGGTGDGVKTWRLNGSQSSCQIAGSTWSYSKCSLEGMCNKKDATGKDITSKAACDAVGGAFKYATDIVRCEDAGGKWTGNNTNRGQIITAMCMQCHRQENKGLPYTNGTCSNPVYTDQGSCVAGGGTWTDTGNGLPLIVGPYHNSVAFPSHPHSNQLLNSPHGEYTGKWSEIATSKFGAGYGSDFQIDGEIVNAGNTCTGCHNVHAGVVAGAEPFEKTCTDCHSTAGDIAPQINLALINHLAGPGTPLEDMGTEPSEACVVCHMPGGKHLFRINTSAGYSTFPMPAAINGNVSANTAPEGGFTNAVWNDLDASCGQCHGGGTAKVTTTGDIATGSATLTVASAAGLLANERITIANAGAYLAPNVYDTFETYIKTVAGNTVTLAGKATHGVTGSAVVQNPTKNSAPYYTKAALAGVASGMHDSSGVTYPTTFSMVITGLTVAPTAVVFCGGGCPTFTYDWVWGDGNYVIDGGKTPVPHVYAAPGQYVINLVVRLNGLVAGAASRTVNVSTAELPPVVTSAFNFDANTWTATLRDTSTDTDPWPIATVMVDWGDGSTKSAGHQGDTFTHVYTQTAPIPGYYTITHTATDTYPKMGTEIPKPTVSPAYFKIGGKVMNKAGTAGIPGATVQLKKGTNFLLTLTTAVDGSFLASSLKPGTYVVTVTKPGYTFPNPAATLTIGPDSLGNIIKATAP
ncbi:MAG: carboxypeptidase regulatory-like domain-containing protein [Acidobacteriota bacterium]